MYSQYSLTDRKSIRYKWMNLKAGCRSGAAVARNMARTVQKWLTSTCRLDFGLAGTENGLLPRMPPIYRKHLPTSSSSGLDSAYKRGRVCRRPGGHPFSEMVVTVHLGDWNVEEGPIATLDRVVKQINAITECVVCAPMFAATDLRRLCFPSSENTHRYEDAHAELYRLIVDGLDKDVITAVGKKLGITVTAGNKRTLDALEMLFPQEPVRAAVRTPLDVVSEQRRRASHKERSPAQSFPAFEEFEKNLRAIISSVSIVRDDLAERLNVNIERCEARASAMKQLPVFDETRPTQSNYSIFAARNIVGKNVTFVRTGELVSEPGRAEMEAIVMKFSDGSIMSIEPATNISQIISDDAPIDPQALHVTLYVNYVPSLLPFTK